MLLKRLDSHLSSILLVSLGPDCTRTKVMLGAVSRNACCCMGCYGQCAYRLMIYIYAYTHIRVLLAPAARTIKDYDKSRAGIERYALSQHNQMKGLH